MQGSMGHAAAIGLGIALNQPRKQIIVLDGDGALLMHMGILSTIGYYKPKNLCHVVLDNESYESTGNQATTSSTTDFKKIALAVGYRQAYEASYEKELKYVLKQALHAEGPTLTRVKINKLPTENIPRITSKYTASDITRIFMKDLLA